MLTNSDFEAAMERAWLWNQAWGAVIARALHESSPPSAASMARAVRALWRMSIAADRRHALWLAQRNAGMGPWGCLRVPDLRSQARRSQS